MVSLYNLHFLLLNIAEFTLLSTVNDQFLKIQLVEAEAQDCDLEIEMVKERNEVAQDLEMQLAEKQTDIAIASHYKIVQSMDNLYICAVIGAVLIVFLCRLFYSLFVIFLFGFPFTMTILEVIASMIINEDVNVGQCIFCVCSKCIMCFIIWLQVVYIIDMLTIY